MAARAVGPLIGKSHELGHDAIDREHQAIADCWHRAVTCEPMQLEFMAARLRRLMRNHFDHESALMQRAGGGLCECHRREHQMLLDLCEQARTLRLRDWRGAQSLLRNRLPRLVREHIICMDQLAVLFINTNGRNADVTNTRFD